MLATAVHVADALVDALRDGEGSDAARQKLDLAFLERTDSARHLPDWRAIAEHVAILIEARFIEP